MRRPLGLLVAVALASVGCDGEPVAGVSAPVVYGTDGRTEVFAHPIAELRAVAETAAAVEMSASALDMRDPANVRVTYRRTLGEAKSLCAGERFADQIEPGTCSGTLIDDRHILTAGHCVDASSDCGAGTGRVWVLGFRYASDGVLARLDADDVYRCERVLAYRDDGEADHAVVELDRTVVGHTPAPVRALPAGVALGTPVALIGHPNGIPMKIDSGGTVTVTSSDGVWLSATVDAFDGNSGSGVFDHAGNLLALLDGGETDYVARGGCNVVNVIDPPPTDDGESMTYVRPAIDAFCATPGVVSPLCDCEGACVPFPPGNRCDEAEALEATSQVRTDTLAGFANIESGSCGGNGPERVYAFTVSVPTRLTARAAGFDTVLYLRAGCTGPEVVCNDDLSDSDRSSRITATLDPGDYAIFVDAYDGDAGTFTLTLMFEPLDGSDGGPAADAGSGGDGGPAPGSDAGAGADGGGAGGKSGGCAVGPGRPPGPAHASILLLLGVALLLRLRRRRPKAVSAPPVRRSARG